MAAVRMTLVALLLVQCAYSCRYFCKDESTGQYECCKQGGAGGGNGGNDGGNNTGGNEDTNTGYDVHKVVVTQHGPEDGAKYNVSSSCRYYCAYASSVYCCDDGSLTSKSGPDADVDVEGDSDDLTQDTPIPNHAKIRYKTYSQAKKSLHKLQQQVTRDLDEVSPGPAKRRSKRVKREESEEEPEELEVFEKSSVVEHNRMDSVGRSFRPLSGYASQMIGTGLPLNPNAPVIAPPITRKVQGSNIENITVSFDSLPSLPGKIPPRPRGRPFNPANRKNFNGLPGSNKFSNPQHQFRLGGYGAGYSNIRQPLNPLMNPNLLQGESDKPDEGDGDGYFNSSFLTNFFSDLFFGSSSDDTARDTTVVKKSFPPMNPISRTANAFGNSFPQPNPFANSQGFGSGGSFQRAISPSLFPPVGPNVRVRRHPAIGNSFSSINSLTRPNQRFPSTTNTRFPSITNPRFPSITNPGFAGTTNPRFPSSANPLGPSFQNSITQQLHQVHPLLRPSGGPSSSIGGSLSPTTFNRPPPLHTSHSFSLNPFVSSPAHSQGFSSHVKGDDVLPPSSLRPFGGLRPPPHEIHHHATSHHAPSHHAPSHHAPSHHAPSHHAPSHHAPPHHAPSHHSTPHHATEVKSHTAVHNIGPHHAREHIQHNVPHSDNEEGTFSYVDAQGNRHIHISSGSSPVSHGHPPHPPPSHSFPSHPPPAPQVHHSPPHHIAAPPHHPPAPLPPLSTISSNIRPPAALLPLESHTPGVPDDLSDTLLPPSPPRTNREASIVSSLEKEPSAEVILNIGEMTSRYKGVKEITLNIGDSNSDGSNISFDESDDGEKRLVVSFPAHDLQESGFFSNLSPTLFSKSKRTARPSNSKRDTKKKRTSSQKRPLSFPEDIPFFDDDGIEPKTIGDQIIKETDAPTFFSESDVTKFRAEAAISNSPFKNDFPPFSRTPREPNYTPPIYLPDSSKQSFHPGFLEGKQLERFKKYMLEENFDFAFDDTFGGGFPSSSKKPLPPRLEKSTTRNNDALFNSPFHLIQHAKPKTVAEQIMVLETICPCLARPKAVVNRDHCRCPAVDSVAVVFRRSKREPYIVMTYKDFLVDRLALDLEANLNSVNTDVVGPPSVLPPNSDWRPIIGGGRPAAAGLLPNDKRHIEDMFLVSIPEGKLKGRNVRDSSSKSELDAHKLTTIRNAIESFVRAVDHHAP